MWDGMYIGATYRHKGSVKSHLGRGGGAEREKEEGRRGGGEETAMTSRFPKLDFWTKLTRSSAGVHYRARPTVGSRNVQLLYST